MATIPRNGNVLIYTTQWNRKVLEYIYIAVAIVVCWLFIKWTMWED